VPKSRKRGAPSGRRGRIRKLRLLLLLAVLTFLATCSFAFGLVAAIASELPTLETVRQQQREREVNGYIYANDGRTILAVLRGDENRVFVDWDDIHPHVKHAIVAVEDRRFWEHEGLDVRGIGRALWADIRSREVVEGGSTITQQYVKSVYVGNQRSIARKLREAALAWQLDERWSKEKILTEYLNTIYFGNGAYGIHQAARIYFDKAPDDLELHEAALLAGIPSDPTGYDPVTRPGAARARRAHVLSAMLDLRWITRGEYEDAIATPLPRPQDVRRPGNPTPHAPYFTDYVRQQLLERYQPGRVFGGGFRVTTTVDLGLQRIARQAIAKWLPDEEGPSAALVALDPQTGDVLAMVGGRNYRVSQFNIATQSRRQPGSTFKPFVLTAAVERGVSPATTFVSKPLSIDLGDRLYQVSNYENAYLGSTTVETGTVHSDNAVYMQLTELIGPKAVARTAERLGVASRLNGYFSIGLGGESVNPLELARAYAVFANGGYRVDTALFKNRPRVVTELRDAGGHLLSRNTALPRPVIRKETAATVNRLLTAAMQRGTGRRAQLPKWPAAGKTGTTENYGDAWFVGYTPELVTAVWVGYPNRLQPMLTEFHGEPVAGGTFPALVWKSFMERALPYRDAQPLTFEPSPYQPATSRVVTTRNGTLELDNGLCPETRSVVLFLDAEPPPTADCRENEVDVPRVVGMTLAAAKARLAAQPLSSTTIYRPAKPRQRVDIVLGQMPGEGRLSSFDEVTLVVAKPLHGVVPDVKGLMLADARKRLRGRGLVPRVTRFADGGPRRVLAQSPPAGVAAAPGMMIRLTVGRYS
jgi:penicillin-binding protein 1A